MSQIYFNSPSSDQNDQIESFQTTLASLNQRLVSLQEALQEREREIAKLKEPKKTFQTAFPYFFLFSGVIIIILAFAFQINLFTSFWEILLSAIIITACVNYIKNFIQKFLVNK